MFIYICMIHEMLMCMPLSALYAIYKVLWNTVYISIPPLFPSFLHTLMRIREVVAILVVPHLGTVFFLVIIYYHGLLNANLLFLVLVLRLSIVV